MSWTQARLESSPDNRRQYVTDVLRTLTVLSSRKLHRLRGYLEKPSEHVLKMLLNELDCVHHQPRHPPWLAPPDCCRAETCLRSSRKKSLPLAMVPAAKTKSMYIPCIVMGRAHALHPMGFLVFRSEILFLVCTMALSYRSPA